MFGGAIGRTTALRDVVVAAGGPAGSPTVAGVELDVAIGGKGLWMGAIFFVTGMVTSWVWVGSFFVGAIFFVTGIETSCG